MKAVIMAGGFAKRMWPLTTGRPKPLLMISGKPIVEHIVENLENVRSIDKIYIATNKKFEDHFNNWIKTTKLDGKIKLIIEPASKEEEKKGSIGALDYLINTEQINDDLIVVAGDNLFDFRLKDFVDYYHEKKGVVIAFYDIGDLLAAQKFGVGELDSNGKLVDFLEKPEKPKSTFVSTGCYIFPKDVLKTVSTYLKDKNNPDAPGYFISWLYKKLAIYGFKFKGKWYDVGSFEAYLEAEKEYKKRNRL